MHWSLGRKGRFVVPLQYAIASFQAFFELLKYRHNENLIIIYHSRYFLSPILRLTSKWRLPYLLEMEEVYADIRGGERTRTKELEVVKRSQGLILSSETIRTHISSQDKQCVVCHGDYRTQELVDIDKFSKKDGRIHLVYAGTLEIEKGGARFAVAAARYLSSQFHLHILGFGTKREVMDIESRIAAVQPTTGCNITFHGKLTGSEYSAFIQSCDIGLSTQNMDDEFNETSFPSKILSYLNNGLKVVSGKIKVIEESDLKSIVFFYSNNSAQSIAECILEASNSETPDPVGVIRQMDLNCLRSLERMLTEMGAGNNGSHRGEG